MSEIKEIKLGRVAIRNRSFEQICNDVILKAEIATGLSFNSEVDSDSASTTCEHWQSCSYEAIDRGVSFTVDITLTYSAKGTVVTADVYEYHLDNDGDILDSVLIAEGKKVLEN